MLVEVTRVEKDDEEEEEEEEEEVVVVVVVVVVVGSSEVGSSGKARLSEKVVLVLLCCRGRCRQGRLWVPAIKVGSRSCHQCVCHQCVYYQGVCHQGGFGILPSRQVRVRVGQVWGSLHTLQADQVWVRSVPCR